MIRKEWIAVLAALMLLASIGSASAQPDPTAWTTLEKGNFGVGLGEGFGGIGFKYESAAFGGSMTAVVAPGLTASNIALKYYMPIGSNPGARNFAALHYGIARTGISSDDSITRWTGLSIGIGRRWAHWEIEGGFLPKPSSFSLADEIEFGDWVPVYIGVGYNF